MKCCLLQHSGDENVKAIYKLKKERVSEFTTRWTAPNELAKIEPAAEFEQRYAGQQSRAGLGFNRYIAEPTMRQRREQITTTLSAQHEEEDVRHACTLVRQGVWTHWDVIPFDFSWTNLIYGPGPHVIRFVLNAQINSVRTPDLLKLWGYQESAECKLCGAVQCTLHHILVNCTFALEQGRYTWRHDSVLKGIERALVDGLRDFNSRKPSVCAEVARKEFQACFVREGAKPKKGSAESKQRRGLLNYANDWKMQVDFKDHELVFPPAICATSLRPDAVLWSIMSHVVILLELTCCAEEGFSAAQLRKESRYAGLLQEINESKTWKASLLTLEVGARGLVSPRTFRAFTSLGFSTSKAKQICKELSEVVVRCSIGKILSGPTRTLSLRNKRRNLNNRK